MTKDGSAGRRRLLVDTLRDPKTLVDRLIMGVVLAPPPSAKEKRKGATTRGLPKR